MFRRVLSNRTSSPPDGPVKARPLVDSGLFWLLVFALMAVGGYLAVSPKYERRQDGIQTKFEGRRQAWLNQIDGEIDSPESVPSASGGDWWLLGVVSLSILLVLGSAARLLLRGWTNPPAYQQPKETPTRPTHEHDP